MTTIPSWWRCDTHGEALPHNSWGCPSCVVELRTLVRDGDARIAELLDELLREGEDHAQSVRDAAEILRQLNAAERRLVAAERVAKSLDWIMSNAGEWCHGNVNADVDREAIAALAAYRSQA